MSSFDGFWDNMTGMANGRDDLMLGSDGQIARKKEHNAAMTSMTDESVVEGIMGVQDPMQQQAEQAFAEGIEEQKELELVRLGSGALGLPISVALAGIDLVSLPILITRGVINAEEGKMLESLLKEAENIPSAQVGSRLQGLVADMGYSQETVDAFGEGYLAGELLGIFSGALPGLKLAAKGAGKLKEAGQRMMSGPATATKVDAAAESIEPIVVENPEAGPFDRSQLPEQMQKPEPKPAEIDELGFVQKSLEVAKNLQQQKGTAAQFIKRLKQNGVSDEEIDALGLREKFKSNERITRAQLEQTIRDRRIELQEKVKGSDVEVSEDAYEFDDITFGQGEVDMDSGNWSARADDFFEDAKDGEEFAVATVMDKLAETYPDSYSPEEIARIRQALINKEFDELDSIDRSNIEDAASDVAEAEYLENPYQTYRSNETDNYQIYGNDDIGYTVLRYGNEAVNETPVYNLNEAQIIARQDAYEQGDLMGAGAETEARFEDFMLPGGENYQEVLIKDPSTPATSYPGDHWSEGNVIGHLLTKDRVDSTGKKALYVEEVQSDFAQSARAKFSRTKRKIDVQMQRTNERVEAIKKTIEELNKRIENPIEGDDVELLKQSLGTKQSGLKSEMRSKELLEQQLQEASDRFDVETEELSKVRFVKDTQQWLRPTLKRLIAKAIEGGYDSVAVPPFQIVHSRYGEDYGDFYRKSVPNTLLKAAKQLDPNAKISRADFSDSLRKGDGADERVIAEAQKAGIEGVQIIEITPAMRKAYEEKGQSLFVPAAGAAIAGKMAVDQMTKEQEDDRAKATR